MDYHLDPNAILQGKSYHIVWVVQSVKCIQPFKSKFIHRNVIWYLHAR